MAAPAIASQGGTVTIPYTPRPHQAELHSLRPKYRWALLVCHRRFGKTVFSVNELIRDALSSRKTHPRYAYMAPLLKQAKAISWDFFKHYTHPIPGRALSESELRIDFQHNRSRVMLLGADNPDALRGMYLDGVILDEYGQMPAKTWGEVIRPLLADRQGWAIILGTPAGKNAFYEQYQNARRDSEWLVRVYRASETEIIPSAELASARKDMTSEQYAQEFECSWSAGIPGSYYAHLLDVADGEKRLSRVPYDPALPVKTAWDLGIGDATAIWFAQVTGNEVRLIDYLENDGEGLAYYAKEVSERGTGGMKYVYDQHIAPHDVTVRELGSGKSRLEVSEELGIRFDVAPRIKLGDGIDACRNLLPRCWFDWDRCSQGIDALRNYRREVNERTGELRERPLHNWASHGADAFRSLATGIREIHRWKDRKPDTRWVV